LSSQPAGITDSSRLNPASSLPIPSAYQCFYVLLSKRLWGVGTRGGNRRGIWAALQNPAEASFEQIFL
ncbi:MAG: hypothetical protein LBD31_02070, partial [Treponema sp.]|nr:hypothetical protein [Treponema sp.]